MYQICRNLKAGSETSTNYFERKTQNAFFKEAVQI